MCFLTPSTWCGISSCSVAYPNAMLSNTIYLYLSVKGKLNLYFFQACTLNIHFSDSTSRSPNTFVEGLCVGDLLCRDVTDKEKGGSKPLSSVMHFPLDTAAATESYFPAFLPLSSLFHVQLWNALQNRVNCKNLICLMLFSLFAIFKLALKDPDLGKVHTKQPVTQTSCERPCRVKVIGSYYLSVW